MKREILFRGKRVDNGKWVEGSLINNAFWKSATNEPCFYIFSQNSPEYCIDCWEDMNDEVMLEVIPETVGQFTGLLDKNGVKIFERDVVRVNSLLSSPHNEKAVITFHRNSWCVDMSSFYPKCREGWVERITNNMTFEIASNIHDKEQTK